VLGAATGSIAGLAAITPASGYVGPMGAIVIGSISAVVCFYFATAVKRRFRYDDSLDVFGVHGVGGVVGTALVAVFASKSLGGSVADHNIVSSLMVQGGAAAITAIYSITATVVILKAVDLLIGLRVTGVAEQQGLDLSEHEERGYTI
jgi:ammonium transporter, Amt family